MFDNYADRVPAFAWISRAADFCGPWIYVRMCALWVVSICVTLSSYLDRQYPPVYDGLNMLFLDRRL
jgi:hypothetical protein